VKVKQGAAVFDPVDLYRRAATGTLAVASAIRPDQLGLPTPCDEWTVQEVLDHLVGGTSYLTAAIKGLEVPRVDSGATADDLHEGVTVCLELLADPQALGSTCSSPLGTEWTVAEATAGTSMDLLVHTWDLAAATGQDVALDPVVLEACIGMFLPHMPEMGRAAGIVGPAVEVPSNASPQQLLLGAMGRRA
jgi:uncharacterized protein (TIGR03086 family)